MSSRNSNNLLTIPFANYTGCVARQKCRAHCSACLMYLAWPYIDGAKRWQTISPTASSMTDQLADKTFRLLIISVTARMHWHSHPEGQICGQNSQFWQFWGLYSHISAAINVKVGMGELTFSPLPRAKFHLYRVKCGARRAEKPIFGPLSKNNTGILLRPFASVFLLDIFTCPCSFI